MLIYFFGIERSLQYLSLVNLTLGLTVCASLLRCVLSPVEHCSSGGYCWCLSLHDPETLRIWDTKHFAIFNHNARQAFTTEGKRADLAAIAEALYYAEGTTSTVSVVKIKGGSQGLNVNGRTVASTDRQDQQCQYTLGHLPMLLHKNPKKVWVLGMGTGMTAGATSVHPEVESVTVAELEKHVVPAARTFADYNHHFLDNPKVNVVFNDGRNFLLTTKERYDVITADPIHPWSQGAAYLYTDEYYRLAASRLRAGGIMCQWLPIYELTPRDLQSVVKTFANNFKYVYVWLTAYDAELIGSNEPIEINLETLQKRIDKSPEVLSDLKRVDMGSAADFVSYAVMGPSASNAYGKNAPLNTDDNLYLEFSAPDSKGKAELIAVNIASLSSHREDISGYLAGNSLYSVLGTNPAEFQRAVRIYDKAHLWHYQNQVPQKGYAQLMDIMEKQFAWYAPGQFLRSEYQTFLLRIPQLLGEMQLTFANTEGLPVVLTLSAVTLKLNPELVRLLIVDNKVKKIHGFIYVEGDAGEIDQKVYQRFVRLKQLILSVYQREQTTSALPPALPTMGKIEMAINHLKSGTI